MYLVAGLGITGQSVLRYFEAQGEHSLAFDTREAFDIEVLQSDFSHIEFALGKVPNDWLHRFKTIVLSPGISKSEPWVLALIKLGKQVIGDIELFARAVGAPVIAITGSNGKSTVTTMTGIALQEAGYQVGIGGNIGEPILDLILDDIEYDVFVLELSSFQLETTYSLDTVAATVLNISEDHMDRYDEIEDYIQAKTKVFATTDLAIIPEGFSDQGIIHHAKISHFGLSEQFITSDSDFGLIQTEQGGGQPWLGYGSTPLVPVAEMKLQGAHHQLNALAMMALCQPFEVKAEHFLSVVKNFGGLPHRTQLVGVYSGIEWVNDSKGTNVGAALTAIESIGSQITGKLVLIAGGVGKGADFSDLKPSVNHFCRHTVLFGRDQQIIGEQLAAGELTYVENIEQAVEAAQSIAQPGDCVLFSPACASFDQFANYIQRGDIFMQLVEICHQDVSEKLC
ncbi:MAG: UDP-N-acetylmuramoylalanine--D-glutamate ligase [Thiomicrorhabdus sp.]|nr:MAG: UDP-N-acetylmuramoylalanine--D-glutamate ligase [Thiomicrorhabdus sp.]